MDPAGPHHLHPGAVGVALPRDHLDTGGAYADSKLFDVALAFAVARRWPAVLSDALEPGWVPIRMGGPGAADALSLGPVKQAWRAVSDEPAATVTGGYS
jgi:hypothetical protein